MADDAHQALLQEVNTRRNNLARALKRERAKSRKLAAKLAEREGAGAAPPPGQAKAPEPAGKDDADKRLADALAENARLKHFEVFRDAAIAAGVAPKFVRDLYQLSGLTPGDKPAKAADFAEFLTAAKTERAWSFANGGAEPTDSADAGGSSSSGAGGGGIELGQAQPPAVLDGRGQPNPTSGRFTFKASDLANPSWMARNQEKLAKAVKDGTAHQLPG
jgi:hypothetical protein